jgi:hypothetical protein
MNPLSYGHEKYPSHRMTAGGVSLTYIIIRNKAGRAVNLFKNQLGIIHQLHP